MNNFPELFFFIFCAIVEVDLKKIQHCGFFLTTKLTLPATLINMLEIEH